MPYSATRAWKTFVTINLGTCGTEWTMGWKQASWPIWSGPSLLFELTAGFHSGRNPAVLSQANFSQLDLPPTIVIGWEGAQLTLLFYVSSLGKKNSNVSSVQLGPTQIFNLMTWCAMWRTFPAEQRQRICSRHFVPGSANSSHILEKEAGCWGRIRRKDHLLLEGCCLGDELLTHFGRLCMQRCWVQNAMFIFTRAVSIPKVIEPKLKDLQRFAHSPRKWVFGSQVAAE